MEVVAIDPPGEREWEQLIDGEEQPWGPAGEGLKWAEKERHVGVRDAHGRLLATAGATRVRVRVGGSEELDVVGIGGLFVTHSMRGRGLLHPLARAVLQIAREMGPEHAMLFCRPELVPVYARLGFELIGARVLAEQPAGAVVVPLEAMHLTLAPGAVWPEGEVHVLGLPF
jgi:predicted N-acetyltransferase YhbS